MGLTMYGESTPLFPIPLLIGPEDLSEGASASPWIDMGKCRAGLIVIAIGDLGGAVSAVSLDQATDNSGTGSKTLGFTKYYTTGQRLAIGTVSGTFSAGETITGGTSANTAYLIIARSDELVVGFLTGNTTWTDGETLTGGTSGATAVLSGTGKDEDIPVERTAAANTFNTVAATFKVYTIPVDSAMLDVTNGFTHIQLDMGDAAAAETQGCALFFPLDMRISKYPAESLIGAQKFA